MVCSTCQFCLAGLLISAGSVHLLVSKWTDMAVVAGSPQGHLRNGSSTHLPHPFVHPALQTFGMFLGELMCLAIFKITLWLYNRRAGDPSDESRMPNALTGNRSFNPTIFILPALCDMITTTLMYIGLNLTFVASAQMFRGAVLVFISLISTLILRRRQKWSQWIGIVIVVTGLALLGFTDWFLTRESGTSTREMNAPSIITGDLLIVAAQIVAALQMTLVEEKLVAGSNVPPMQAVGWIGLFGAFFTVIVLIVLYFVQIGGAPVEDTIDGLYQIYNSPQVAIGISIAILSVSSFNVASASLIRELPASTNIALDSLRTIVIWTFSIVTQWQQFTMMTLVGLSLLTIGSMLYSNVLTVPTIASRRGVAGPGDDDANSDRRRLLE